MKKRIIFLILTVLFVIFTIMSCAKADSNKEDLTENKNSIENNDNGIITEEPQKDIYADGLLEHDFDGAEFRIAAVDASWLNVIYDSQEENGDLINDAVYLRNRKIEERFNVQITQKMAAGNLKKNVNSGADAFDLYLPIDRDALTYGAQGLIYKVSEIPNIDIDKPYWSQSINKCMTIGGDLYYAYGAFNLSVYDYTHVLLFNKQMILDIGLGNPYSLVKSGNWTIDKYGEMAKAAVKDLDGNGEMDQNDVFGLYSADKQVLPCFWIAAGVQSISKSGDDIPLFTLREDEKFAAVIDKIFAVTYDNNSWYRKSYSDAKMAYFMSGHALFVNATFKSVGDLRGIETEFGIIPYPKYTSEQNNYYTRVEGGNPGVVTVTSSNLEMIGTILETLNAESAKTVIPAYYDITLKIKNARDEDSAEMLDLIFESRIYDLGDTYWCEILRDGIFLSMFSKNDRNLASQLEKVEPKINAAIEKVVKGNG